MVELYLHSSVFLNGILLNYIVKYRDDCALFVLPLFEFREELF
jgi:hypothetical protein